MLEVLTLTRDFGAFRAVDQVSFVLCPGEVVVFLGPNGAGKTTTLRMIMGILPPTGGTVRLEGVTLGLGDWALRSRLGYMSQRYSLYPTLTAEENLAFNAGAHGMPRASIRAVQEGLRERYGREAMRQRVENLPTGIRQGLALELCLLHDPHFILLDEPTSGTDPEQRRRFWLEIYRQKHAGRTVLVTTHHLDEAEYADRLLIIHQGRIVLDGEPHASKARFGVDTIEALFMEVIGGDS